MLSYIHRQKEFSVPAILYIYKENYTRGTSILVFANRANKSSPANNYVLLQTKLGGIGDFFDLFDRREIYRSTLSVIGCRLVDKASCCRTQACNRTMSISHYQRTKYIALSVCLCQRFKFMTNEASVLSLLLSVGGLWVRGPVEGFLLLFLKFFLSPVGCWVLCSGCKGVGVHCLLYLPVVCCWLSGDGRWLSSADSRLSGVTGVGSWLSTVGWQLLVVDFLCSNCRAVFFYCRCPALFTIVENNTLLAKQRFFVISLGKYRCL